MSPHLPSDPAAIQSARDLETEGRWAPALAAWLRIGGERPPPTVERRILRCLIEAGLFEVARKRLSAFVASGDNVHSAKASLLRRYAVALARAGRAHEGERTLIELAGAGVEEARVARALLITQSPKLDAASIAAVEAGLAARGVSIADGTRMLVWLARARGVDASLAEEIGSLVDQFGSESALLDRLWLDLLVERDAAGAARRVLESPSLRAAARAQPHLASALAPHLTGEDLGRELERLAQFDRAIRASHARFAERAARPGTTIAVVGNGPSELGKRRGAEIDARDIIIRFNRFSVAPEFAADYGSRIDVHWRFLWHEDDVDEVSARATLIAVAELQARQIAAANWRSIVQLHEAGRDVMVFPAALHHELSEELGSRPSSGMQALWLLRRLRGPLRDDQVFGFSFVTSALGEESFHYFAPAEAATVHDWENEFVFFHARILGRLDSR